MTMENEIRSCDYCPSHELERPIRWCESCDHDLCGPCFDSHACMCEDFDDIEAIYDDAERGDL